MSGSRSLGDEDLETSSTDSSASLEMLAPSSNIIMASPDFSNHWNSAQAVTPPQRGPDLQRSRQDNPVSNRLIWANRSNASPRSASFSARIRGAGGVNSVDNFARSWQRAAYFPEVIPRWTSQAVEPDDAPTAQLYENESQDYRRPAPQPQLSRPSFYENGRASLTFPRSGASGASYGTMATDSGSQPKISNFLGHEPQMQERDLANCSKQPLLSKRAQGGSSASSRAVVGQSTVPQTIGNSVNVLIGVGLLSLPLAMKQAGWLLGLSFLVFAAITTAYTAKILAKCLDVDPELVTYADLAYVSFGHYARWVISVLFCLELAGACVALVVLFGDSLHALIPAFSVLEWEIVCGITILPLSFVPLRLLSVTSVLGIISCTAIVLIIFIDGLIKPDAPGSLLQPSKTTLFPSTWTTVPLSFGLIMSPWGGHGVFPNIYRDMRHPAKYGKSLWSTYIFTFLLDCSMAVIGWLMFGDAVRDEITGNILVSDEYPRSLTICLIIFISIVPITKVPLSSRPLVATAEILCGLEQRPSAITEPQKGVKDSINQSLRFLTRIFVVGAIVFVAVVFPSFDRIMALMGSALCFTICIILPVAFYLKIFGKEISLGERIFDWILLVTSSVLAIVGTIWAFLPQSVIAGG